MKDQAVGNSRVEKGIFRSSQSEPSCFHRCKSAICNARSSAGKTCGNEQSFPAPPVFKLEMSREVIKDSKTRRQNPLLRAGVSSKGRDSDFDRWYFYQHHLWMEMTLLSPGIASVVLCRRSITPVGNFTNTQLPLPSLLSRTCN